MKCMIHRAVHWTTLRPVGNSVIVKLTISIPAIGYLIVFNDKLVGYVNLIREVAGLDESSGLSVPPRRFQIYFRTLLRRGRVCDLFTGMPIHHKTLSVPRSISGAATMNAVGDYGYANFEREVLSLRYSDEYQTIKQHFQHMVDRDFRMEQAKFQVNNALINIYFSLKNSEPLKYPITGIVGCCARATVATRKPGRRGSAMNSRRLMPGMGLPSQVPPPINTT